VRSSQEILLGNKNLSEHVTEVAVQASSGKAILFHCGQHKLWRDLLSGPDCAEVEQSSEPTVRTGLG
jgi:hypothetical protein